MKRTMWLKQMAGSVACGALALVMLAGCSGTGAENLGDSSSEQTVGMEKTGTSDETKKVSILVSQGRNTEGLQKYAEQSRG